MSDISMKTVGDKIAIAVTIQRAINDNGGATFHTTVPQDVSEQEFDAVIDMLHKAGRRLAAWGALEKVENELEQHDYAVLQSSASARILTEKVLGPRALTEDKNQLRQAEQHIKAGEIIRPKLVQKIASLQNELRGATKGQ